MAWRHRTSKGQGYVITLIPCISFLPLHPNVYGLFQAFITIFTVFGTNHLQNSKTAFVSILTVHLDNVLLISVHKH